MSEEKSHYDRHCIQDEISQNVTQVCHKNQEQSYAQRPTSNDTSISEHADIPVGSNGEPCNKHDDTRAARFLLNHDDIQHYADENEEELNARTEVDINNHLDGDEDVFSGENFEPINYSITELRQEGVSVNQSDLSQVETDKEKDVDSDSESLKEIVIQENISMSTPLHEKDHAKDNVEKHQGKSFKERIGQIPNRLSKFSLFNAIRSGSYLVSEPSPMPSDPHCVSPSSADQVLMMKEKLSDKFDDDQNTQESQQVTDNSALTEKCRLIKENNPKFEAALPEIPEDETDNLEASPAVMGICLLKRKKNSIQRSALTKLLCGLYALILVVFGLVFSVSDSLTRKERHHLYYLEVFLLYLYVGSLIILFYFHWFILKGKQVRNVYLDNSIRIVLRRSQDNIHLSPTVARKESFSSRSMKNKETDDCEMNLETRRYPLDQTSTMSNASDIRCHMTLPPSGQVAHVGEGINFYLRLGALAFSIGSVTLDGFHIASYLETVNTSTCESRIFILVFLLHVIYTFIQTFFVFKNHKLVIDKNKASVRFGLMHLLATNICIWFVTAVTETADDFRQQKYFSERNETHPPEVKSCYEDLTLARTASPYLFPCTVIYSIIVSGIVYRMYTYVGVKVKQRWPSHTSLTSTAAPQGVVSMDCEKANKGLFTGLLVAVITLIAIATFFVFESRLNNPTTAVKVFFIMEMSLLLLTGGCVLAGCLRFRNLQFAENFLSLDAILLLVSLSGAIVYLCFMLISSASTLAQYGAISLISLLTIITGLVQATLQAIFILDGLCRRAANDTQVEQKPGRAVVTFLLVCNLALWLVTLFEVRKTMVLPFHLAFYGILPWNIILHLCVPLYIYFRFHSAICLSKIWFNAYQKGEKLN